MKPVLRWFIIAAAGCASAALACTEPSDPAPVSGLFVLQSIGGDALPTSSFTGRFGPLIVAETLDFRPRVRRGRSPAVVRRNVDQQRSSSSTEFYALVGATVEFLLPPCNDTMSCYWNFPTGTLNGDELIVRYGDPTLRERLYLRAP